MSYLKDREIWLSNVPTGNPPAGYFWKFIQNGKVVVRDSSGNNQIMVATSGSQAITGSLTVTGGITGTVSSASYVEYSNVANKPALVSGSAQIAAFGYATTGSNGFNGSQSITGSLTVTGQVVAQTLNVQQVTSSIVYSSGSNIFGNSLANTQQFTGSVGMTGSLAVAGALNGTNATFSGDIRSNAIYRDYQGEALIQTSGSENQIGSAGASTPRSVKIFAGNSTALTIATTGVGNFNSSLRVQGSAVPTSGAGTELAWDGTNGYLLAYNRTTSAYLPLFIQGSSLSFTGAATFSSSVTATQFVANGSGTNDLLYLDAGVNTDFAAKIVSGANDVLVFRRQHVSSGALDIMALGFNGNVGIGTNSPLGPLEVRAANRTVAQDGVLQVNTTNSQAIDLGGSLSFGGMWQNSGTTPTEWAGISGRKENGTNGNYAGYLSLGTRPMGGVITERMRITSDGNVGIGVNPSYKLHVVGGSEVGSRFIVSGTYAPIQFSGDSSTTLGAINAYNGIIAIGRGTSTGINPDITINSSSGNVGIGTTTISNGSVLNLFRTHSASNYVPQLTIQGIGNYNNMELGTFDQYDGYMATRGSDLRILAGLNNTTENRHIAFYTTFNGATGGAQNYERMRITSGGQVFINQSNNIASARFEVSSNSSTSSFAASLNGGGSTTNVLNIYTPGNRSSDTTYTSIQIGDDNAVRFRIFANGNVQNTNGSYGSISDAKLKENIEDATPKLDDLMKVKIRNYNLIGDDKKQIGVIAQELQEVFPAMIDESPDKDKDGKNLGTTTKSVKYSIFVPMLVKAIQEQQALIESLKSRIEILEQ